MVIGISGINKENNSEVAKYFEENNFKVIDVDLIYEKLMQKRESNGFDFFNDLDNNISILNSIDKELMKIISNNNNNLVIKFSKLESLTVFEYIDSVINVNSDKYSCGNISDQIIFDNKLENKKSNYNLEIDFNKNWESQLNEYINFNIKGKEKVSIVVPIYNSSRYLVRCINSICKQNYRNLEIILINDDSTDNSLELCKMMASLDSRIKVISQENKGLSETRNKGLENATGDYVCFIDSDDYMEKDMIETLLKNAVQNNADVSSVRAHVHTRDGNVREYSTERRKTIYDGVDEALNGYADSEISIAVWDKMFKREKIKDIRFDKNVYQEDADFMFKVCMNGGKYVCDTKACYNYFKGNYNSITSSIDKRVFNLSDWAKKTYKQIIEEYGSEHILDANKILYNGLSHVLKMYYRDLKLKKIVPGQYKEEIQQTTNDLLNLLYNSEDISQYIDIENVLNVIRDLKLEKAIDSDKTATKEIHCIGILWNSLNKEQLKSAIEDIKECCEVEDCAIVDLGCNYSDFIDDIYSLDNEFEGVSYLKSSSLIDKYDSNDIAILYLKINATDFAKSKLKGLLYKEVFDLKDGIRKKYKTQIKNYAFDTLFHLTVNEKEFNYTDNVVKKYLFGMDGKKDYGREESCKCKKLSLDRFDKKNI